MKTSISMARRGKFFHLLSFAMADLIIFEKEKRKDEMNPSRSRFLWSFLK